MFYLFVIYLIVVSIVTFIMYAVDKKRAVKKEWRIPEKILLTIGVIGGAMGAIFAMYIIRHKNQKWHFVLTNVFALALHVLVIYLLF